MKVPGISPFLSFSLVLSFSFFMKLAKKPLGGGL